MTKSTKQSPKTEKPEAQQQVCALCGGTDGSHKRVAGKTYKGKRCPNDKGKVKKLKPLKERVADAVQGKGGRRGSRRVNEDGLNAQQEQFCELYASTEEFFGNGTQSYIEAYDVKVGMGKGYTSYDTCRFRAHELLTNPNILKRINEILEAANLNDAFVDKQLGLLIAQNAEFRPKLGAIVEYNKLKKRTSDTVQHVHAFSDIKGMSDVELKAEKEKLQGFFNKK